MMDQKEFQVAKLIGEIKRLLPPEFIQHVQSKGKNRQQIQYLTSIFLIEMGKIKLERDGIEVKPKPKELRKTAPKRNVEGTQQKRSNFPAVSPHNKQQPKVSESRETDKSPAKTPDSPWRYQPSYKKWEPEKIIKKFPKR